MLLIGTVFIITSGAMYFLFIWVFLTLRIELLGEYRNAMRYAIGLVALTAGLNNLKDFCWFKQGISLTISQEWMNRLSKKMKEITDQIKQADSWWKMCLAILSTIILAALVNLIELGCTLILPMEFIEIMIHNYGSELTWPHHFYLALYCLIYVIPLFFVLDTFIYTFESGSLTQKEGRILKLISGSVMVLLGVVLIFKPELLVFA